MKRRLGAISSTNWKALLLNSDPILPLVAEPDILRGLGFFSSLNNDLFRTVTTRSDDAVTTQTFEYTRQTVARC